ncbi:MAG: YfhO family protein [Acidobacteriota bacterium]
MKIIDEGENGGTKRQRIVTAAALVLLPLVYFLPVFIWHLSLAPGDGLTQNLGVRVLIGQMLRAGQLPLWNPYIFAGTPLLASIYPGALYPPNWVFALFSPPTAMNIVVITTYHLTLIGTYLYARRIGANRIGALVAGLAFAFGGFMMSHAGHTSRIAAAAWLPWILLAIEHLYLRLSWRWVGLGSGFIALQLFAGEPQMNFYAVLVCGAYAVVSLVVRERQERRGRFLAGMAAMCICGLLLSMIQLLPERELLRMGERANISYEYFSGYSFPPAQIFTFLFPFFFGGAVAKPYQVEYWGAPTLDETCGYFGLIALLLALAALFGNRFANRQRALVWFWFGAAIVSLVLSFGGFLPFGLNHVLHRTPVYNLFRASGRHMYEFTFSVGILAGLGTTYLAQADRERARRIFKLAALAFIAIIAVTLIVYRFASGAMNIGAEGVRRPGFNSLANPEALIPLLFALISLAAAWFYARRQTSLSGALLVAALFIDLMAFTLAFNWGWRDFLAGVGDRLKDSPPVAFIKSRESDLNGFRIVSQSPHPYGNNYDYLDFPNVSIARGLQSVNGYDALRLLRQSAISGEMGSDGLIGDNSVFGRDHQGFNLLNVKYLLYETPPPDSPERYVEIEGVRFNRAHVYQSMEPGSRMEVATGGATASELVLVTTMSNSTHVPDGAVVLQIRIHAKDGSVIERELQAGRDTAEWAYDKADVRAAIKHGRPKVAESEPAEGFAANRYLARLPFDRTQVESIELNYALPDASVLLLRVSLFDAETKTSTTLDAIDFHTRRWRKLEGFGGVAVYENLLARPRAWFVRRLEAQLSKDVLQTIKTGRLKDGSPFDPAETALFEREDFGNRKVTLPPLGDTANAEVKVTRYEPNRIELQTRNPQQGFLVLSEIYYRGWEAWIDGKRAPIEKVNYTLRGLFVPAGDHRVEVVYRAHSFRNGAAWSLVGLLLLFVAAGANRSGMDRRLWQRLLGLRGSSALRSLPVALFVLSLVYCAVLIKHASRTVGGSDSSGYARLARSILDGNLSPVVTEADQFGLSPEFGQIFVPLAYGWMAESHRMAPIYPLGFPLHIALGVLAIGWKHGPFIVSPVLATLSLWLLYLFARELGLSKALATAGAVILAVNPIFLYGALQPMSDITAMFWALVTMFAALRSRQNAKWAVAAGAAFGLAFLVRPSNIMLLAPLLFVLRLHLKTLLLFVAGGLPLAVLFFGYNYAVFGHPLRTGYNVIGLRDEIGARGFTTRFKHYAYWLVMTCSPLVPLGWLGGAFNRNLEWRNRAMLLAWFGAFLLFYCFYSVYDDWGFLRFLLPGYPALIVGALVAAKALLDWSGKRFAQRQGVVLRAAVSIGLLLVVFGFAHHYINLFWVFSVAKGQKVYADSSRWADRVLPERSLIVSEEVSGALQFYTNRPIARWDLLPLVHWPVFADRVQASGYHLYALLFPYEIEPAQRAMPGRWTRQDQIGQASLWQIESDGQPTASAPVSIKYAEGFSSLEYNDLGESWRWMAYEGLIEVPNSGRTMRLKIEGNLPIDSLPRPSKLTISLNGQALAEITAKERDLEKEFSITPAQQGDGKVSKLQLSTDQVFVPSQANPQNKDQRQLGFSLTKLTWEEAPPSEK